MLITSSEPLDDSLARRIQADLPVDLYSTYVAGEFGEIAADCPAHEGLHVNADQLILEVLGEDGRPVRPGEEGQVVITSLYSYTMPFIRYRLGDLCALVERPCGCGLSLPLIKALIGRKEDVVRVPSLAYRSATALNFMVKKLDEIDHFRFIQERLDRIVMQVVLSSEPSPDLLPNLRTDILDYLGEPMDLEFQVVDSIPEEKRKFRRFISLLAATEDEDDEQERYPLPCSGS